MDRTAHSRWRRAGKWASLGLVGLVLAVLLGARLYLSSSAGARLLRNALGEQLNARIEIASGSVGLFGATSATQLRIYAPDEEQPFLEAERASLDVSAWRALWGRRSPRQLELTGVKLRLRFDRDGNLLTRLPQLAQSDAPMPRLTVHAAEVTLDQQGRTPFLIQNVEVAFTPADSESLSGSIDDPTWGKLSLRGRHDEAAGRFEATLASAGVALTLPMLRALPFVPPKLWDTLEAEGDSVPARLTLTYDPAQKLGYRVAFERARVRLPQPDRPALSVFPAGGVLEGNDHGFTFAGTIRDPYWGDCSVSARQVDAQKTLTIELEMPQAHVDQKKLEALPFVPKKVWQQVKAEGQTSARVRVRLYADKPDVHYRVELRPKETTVRVTAIHLKATNALGEVVIEDDRVWLRGVTAELAGGRLSTSSLMDFRGKDSVLTFDLQAQEVQLQKLPVKEWELPPLIEGRLTAQANLSVTIPDKGPPKFGGKGKGLISHVKVAGFPAAPIPLTLSHDGKRFRFKTPPSTIKALLPIFLVTTQAPPPPALPLDRAASLTAGAVTRLARGIADVAAGTVRQVEKLARGRKPGEPITYLDARISLKDVDLAELLRRLEVELPVALAGKLTVTVDLGIPVNEARSLRAYRFRGRASMPTLKIADIELRRVEARVDYTDGTLRLQSLRGELPRPKEKVPGTFSGTARVAVVPSGPVSVDAQVMNLPATLLARLAPGLKGKLSGDLSGRVRASAPLKKIEDPAAWRGEANVHSPGLTVFGLALSEVSARARAAEGLVNFSALRVRLYKGEVTGSASLPLTGAAGKADLKVQGVNIAALLKDSGVLPLKVEGNISGTAKGTFRLPASDRGLSVEGDVDITAGKLRVQGIAAQRLSGTLRYRDGKGQYNLQGEALGGKFTVEGKFPPPARGSVGEQHGRLRVERLFVGRVARELGLGERARGLRGVMTVDLPFRFDGPDREPVGRGRVAIRDLRWRGSELADDVRGDIHLSGNGLVIRDISGQLAGGTLRLRGALRFRQPSRSWFNLSLTGAEASDLLAFDDELKRAFSGRIDVSLRGSRAGGEWRAAGSVAMRRGKVMGVAVSEWRVPLEVNFSPERGRGELHVRDSAAQVGYGRAQLRMDLNWGDRVRLDGQLRLFDANAGSLAGTLGDISSYAKGRVTGTVDFKADNLRSINDLSATVQATLKETQALQLPVLSLMVPYLAPGQAALTFNEGELKARLGGGVLRIGSLTLASPLVQMIVDGSLTLASGRLDLQAVARTSRLPINPVALRLIARQIPAIGPVPVAVIVRATELLANRVVHLRVTGTLKSPTVRVEPLRQLSEEAVRFLVPRLVPVP